MKYKSVYAVHQASTLCGENETELYSSPVDARVRYTELITEYMSRGDDLHILEHTDHEFYADNESSGTYNRIVLEEIKVK